MSSPKVTFNLTCGKGVTELQNLTNLHLSSFAESHQMQQNNFDVSPYLAGNKQHSMHRVKSAKQSANVYLLYMVLRIVCYTLMTLFSNLVNSIIMNTLEPKMKFNNRGGGACWAVKCGKLCFESCVKT